MTTIFNNMLFDFEIEAPKACFKSVDSSGACAISYPVPPASAIKGVMDSIVGIHKGRGCCMVPISIGICSEINRENYCHNYMGEYRKGNQKSNGSPLQVRSVILVNQKWIVTCTPFSLTGSYHDCKVMLEMFKRYILRGKRLKNITLGRESSFSPSYVGPVRSDTSVNKSLNFRVNQFLVRMYDRPMEGNESPLFRDVNVVKGVLNYDC